MTAQETDLCLRRKLRVNDSLVYRSGNCCKRQTGRASRVLTSEGAVDTAITSSKVAIAKRVKSGGLQVMSMSCSARTRNSVSSRNFIPAAWNQVKNLDRFDLD